MLLTACGGGGSSSPAGSSPRDAVLTSLQGDYASTCTANADTGVAEIYTLHLGPAVGANGMAYTFNGKKYASSNCTTTEPNSDITVRGTLTPTGSQKVITPAAALAGASMGGLNKSATASVVTASLDSFTISKWNGSFPSTVTQVKMGYLHEGNNLYILVNPAKEADGLGAYFSPIPLVKK